VHDAGAALDAGLGEQPQGDGAGGHPRGGLAGGGALQHVAEVLVAVLDAAGEVGVAGAGLGEGALARRVARLRVHDRRPVAPVAVLDLQAQRRPGRAAVADPAQHAGGVRLDDLAPAAAVAALAPPQPRVDVLGRDQGRPAGTPSSSTVRAGPCDSPADRNLSVFIIAPA
jgi:hypothetical protein